MTVDECKKIPQIVQGERKELTVTLLNSNTGEAIDLSTATEIQSVHPREKNIGGYLIKNLEKAAIAQVVDITTVADVSMSLENRYFLLYGPVNLYAFYFTVDGSGSPPVVAGATVVEVAISENDTANLVGATLETAIAAQADFTVSRVNNELTVTNAVAGDAQNPQDFSTGFTFSVTTEGADQVTDSIEVTGTGTLKIKLRQDETPLLKVENRSTMYVSVDFPLPTGRKIYKIGEAYDVLATDFSLN